MITLNAVLPIINQNKILALQNSVSPSGLMKSSQYLLTTWPSIEEEVAVIVGGLSDEAIARTAVLYLESPWGIAYAEAYRSEIAKRNGKIVIDLSQGFGSHDFKVEATRLCGQKISSVLVAHTGANLASFLKQASTMGLSADKIVVPSDAEDREILSAAGEAGYGMSLYSTESKKDSPGRTNFRDAYMQKYSREPAPLGRHAYDQFVLTVEALEECEATTECTLNRLLGLLVFEWVERAYKSNIRPDLSVF